VVQAVDKDELQRLLGPQYLRPAYETYSDAHVSPLDTCHAAEACSSSTTTLQSMLLLLLLLLLWVRQPATAIRGKS
jgi:hypothetical protein